MIRLKEGWLEKNIFSYTNLDWRITRKILRIILNYFDRPIVILGRDEKRLIRPTSTHQRPRIAAHMRSVRTHRLHHGTRGTLLSSFSHGAYALDPLSSVGWRLLCEPKRMKRHIFAAKHANTVALLSLDRADGHVFDLPPIDYLFLYGNINLSRKRFNLNKKFSMWI